MFPARHATHNIQGRDAAMIPAVAYARYSSEKQHGESIEAQLRAMENYCQHNGVEIVQIYIDEAKSATSDDRPNFRRMIHELKQTKPKLVLTHKMDRFARNRYDSAIYKREIQRAGARYIAVDQPIEDTPEGVILESLLEGMAEYYSKNLSREVSAKMKEYAYKAQHLGGIPPLGYDVNQDKQYVINEKEAETVRIIFDMRLEGLSYRTITEALNNGGKKSKIGRPFGKNSIHDILKNEKYCGTFVYNSTPNKINGKRNNRVKRPDDEIIKIKDAFPAIIEKGKWMEVQKMFDSNKKIARSVEDSPYILTGFLRCGHCGGAMTGHTLSKNNAEGERVRYRYYRCCKARRGAGECNHNTRYPAILFEEDVMAAIEKNAAKIKNVDKFAENLWKEMQITNKTRNEDVEHFYKLLKETEEKISNYQQAIAKGANIDYIIQPLNEAGRTKKELERMIEEKRSPFAYITKEDVKSYLLVRQNTVINKNDPDNCKKVISENVDSFTVWDKNTKEIILKYSMNGMPKAGGGGGTPYQAYENILYYKIKVKNK